MGRTFWHIQRAPDALTLARHVPARFDVQAEVALPLAEGAGCDPIRLAQQIRQDLWRAVQRVRGFSPTVHLERDGDVIRVTAGGRVAGVAAPGLSAQIQHVLDHKGRQTRWMTHAGRGRGRF